MKVASSMAAIVVDCKPIKGTRNPTTMARLKLFQK